MANKHVGKVIQMLSPENYIRKKARSLPIYECVLNEDWNFTQMVQLLVARQHTNGNITMCMYLVDLACLGVKDTTYKFNIQMEEYLELIDGINTKMPVIKVSYELAHNIVYAGLEYAEEYGFKPHKDFTSISRFMLEEDTEDIELIEVECGIKGKPTFMHGPFDDLAKVTRIIAQLEKTAGPGNYGVIDEDMEFDEEDDEDLELYEDEVEEFEGMEFAEKKELFLNLFDRSERKSEKEVRTFGCLLNSLADDLVDIDLHNQFYDDFFEELNVQTDENELSDEMLGVSSGSVVIPDELKRRFVEVYVLIEENLKLAKKEFKAFEKEAKGLPAIHFLELYILYTEESGKYPKRLKEYALKFPDYPFIQILWSIEQLTIQKNMQDIQGYPFTLKSFFPERVVLHPMERYFILLLYAFMSSADHNINKIEAFSSVLGDLDLSEEEEGVIGAIVMLLKLDLIIYQLKH